MARFFYIVQCLAPECTCCSGDAPTHALVKFAGVTSDNRIVNM